jgi:hypothetical protein
MSNGHRFSGDADKHTKQWSNRKKTKFPNTITRTLVLNLLPVQYFHRI